MYVATYLSSLLHAFVCMFIRMAVCLQCDVTIDVSPAIDEGVCVLKSPFFINRTNRDLHSSETFKVFIFQIMYLEFIRYTTVAHVRTVCSFRSMYVQMYVATCIIFHS